MLLAEKRSNEPGYQLWVSLKSNKTGSGHWVSVQTVNSEVMRNSIVISIK